MERKSRDAFLCSLYNYVIYVDVKEQEIKPQPCTDPESNPLDCLKIILENYD